MSNPTRLRLVCLLAATLALGIVTRKIPLGVMLWDKSAGDALYAVAVYFALAIALPRASSVTLAPLALIACFGIELFQLTGIPLALAQTQSWHWVRWILGSTFAWHDVLCYALGVPFAAFVHRFARRVDSVSEQVRASAIGSRAGR